MNPAIREYLEGRLSRQELDRQLSASPAIDLEAQAWLRLDGNLRALFAELPEPARQEELLEVLRAEPLPEAEPESGAAEGPLEEELRGALLEAEPLPGGLERLLGRLREEEVAEDAPAPIPLFGARARDVRAASRDLPPEEDGEGEEEEATDQP